MFKRTKKVLSILLVFAMLLPFIPGFALNQAEAAIDGNGYDAINEEYERKQTLEARAPAFNYKSLSNWEPGSNPDDLYNRSTVPLNKDRFQGDQVNPDANPKAKITSTAISLWSHDRASSTGSLDFGVYAFDHWQYIDSMIFWSGTEEGIYNMPSPDIVDAAHRNGVPVYALLGFPWGVYDGIEEIEKMCQKADDGSYPFADKMIEAAKYYNFDGYFFNQESYGGNASHTQMLKDFILYMKKKSEEIGYPIRISWYDSMTNGGNVSYVNGVSSANDTWMKPVTEGKYEGMYAVDEFFMNYNWQRNVASTEAHMKSIGRDPFDAYAGFEVQQNGHQTVRHDAADLLGEDNKTRLSIALFAPNSTMGQAKTPETWYKEEEIFYTGPEGDPSKTKVNFDNETGSRWTGMSRLVTDKSVIKGDEFVTYFVTGQGRHWFDKGVKTKTQDWNNRSFQNIMPTWRWWIRDQKGTRLEAGIDYQDAYYGGNSIFFKGDLEAGSLNNVMLYSTRLDVANDTKLELIYKSMPGVKVSAGLAFDENYTEAELEYYPLSEGDGSWMKDSIDLSAKAGQKVYAISLKFENQDQANDYRFNLGGLKFYRKEAELLESPKNVKVLETLHSASNRAELRITWDPVEGANYYEIYQRNADGKEEIVGTSISANNYAYVPQVSRSLENAREDNTTDIIVKAVNKHMEKAEKGGETTLTWPMDLTEETMAASAEANRNLNIGAEITGVSHEEAGEPARNAIDGTEKNNSKWCSAQRRSGWMSIKYDKPETVQRIRLEHGEYGGEDKSTNTAAWAVDAKIGGAWVEQYKMENNTAAYNDILLPEPVTAQEWRLRIIDSGPSPWAAVRIYEWQHYESTDGARSHNLPFESVRLETLENNMGKVIVQYGEEGDTFRLYTDLEGEPILEEVFGPPVATSDAAESHKKEYEVDLEAIAKAQLLEGTKGKIYYTLTHGELMESKKLPLYYTLEEPVVVPIEKIEYTIYPIPQSTTYRNNAVELTKEVNVVLESGLDEYTVKKVDKVLEKKGLTKVVGTKLDPDKTNLIVGIKGSGEIADKYFRDNIAAKDNFDKIDAYQLSIMDNTIAILGKDTDACFYGLESLDLIFEKKLNTLRQVFINDYANQKIRGVIEGFYGIPWGNENRADLLEFGGRFKNNAFIFAPKDDPYHRDKWREKYPQEELEGISRLAKLGNENKNRFIWTIAPFKPGSNPITSWNYDESIKVLKDKFDQLYDAGVRQFGVLGDDVGNLPQETVVKVMQELVAWAKAKPEPVYDFVFVPAGYVLASWGWRPGELNTYDQGFPKEVQIMFTGQNVCSPVTQYSVNAFKTRQATQTRRDPLFWLNWPVNDVDRDEFRRLFMGKGEMLEVGVENLVGVVTNPLEEPHASLPAIFAVADYTWNTNEFNDQQSWEDGFKYIDPDAHEELKELATHMASANGGGIPGLSESEDMQPLISNFEKVMRGYDVDAIKTNGRALKEAYQKIIDAYDGFVAKTKQTKLKEEMLPYITGLRDKSQAAIKYIDTIMIAKGAESGDKEKAQARYDEGEERYTSSRSHKVVTKTSEFPTKELRAESGTKRINPNIENMRGYAQEAIDQMGEGPVTPPEEADIKGELISRAKEGSDLPLAIASYTNDPVVDENSNDRVEHLNDGIFDYEGSKLNRWTNWRRNPRTGDWIGILLGDGSEAKKYKVDGIKVAFFEDHGCKMPASYKIEYFVPDEAPEIPSRPGHVNMETVNAMKDDSNWKEVENVKGLPPMLYTANEFSFDEVETYAIRFNMKSKANLSLAVTEFEVYGSEIEDGPKGNLTVFAHNEEESGLNAVGFEIYNKEDLENPLDELYTSSESGLTFHDLPYGDYIVKNTAVPEGYEINPEEFEVKIDKEEVELKVLIKKSVDKSELEELVASTEGIDKDKLTDESKQALADAVAAAKEVLEDPDASQEDVDKAVKDLKEVLEKLEYKPSVNKEALNRAIDKASNISDQELDKKTEESRKAFKKALADAIEVRDNPDASQEEVDKALDDLILAIAELTDATSQEDLYTDTLEVMIEVAEAIDKDKLTPESKESLTKAIEAARKVLENPSSQEEIDLAVSQLQTAIENLEFGPVIKKTLFVHTRTDFYVEADTESQVAGEKLVGDRLEGLVHGDFLEIEVEGQTRYIELSKLQDTPPVDSGYAKFTQAIRDEDEKIIGSLPKGQHVVGLVKHNRLEIEYKGLKGRVYLLNLTKEAPIPSGYAKFDQWVRDENGKKIGILSKGSYVEGEFENGKVRFDFKGRPGYVFEQNLQKEKPDTEFSGYARFSQWVRDEQGKKIGILNKGAFVEGKLEGARVRFSFKGKKAYVYKQNLQKERPEFEGYAKFDQWIRDKNGNKVGILKKGTHVSGKVVNGRILVRQGSVEGYVFVLNLKEK